MAHNDRPVFYTPARVHGVFIEMQRQLRELAERHAAETARLRAQLSELRAELDGVRSAFDELRSISLARSRAELELADLRRLRDIGRARATRRDPAAPLQ